MRPNGFHATLGRQLARRLALALVAAFMVVATVSYALYQFALKQAAERQISAVSAFYQVRLAELDDEWEREALKLKSRLEFTHLLDSPAKREAAVRSYFTMQGDDLVFSHVLVLDANGKLLMALGKEAGGWQAPLPQDKHTTSWLYAPENKHLYRVYQQPIWLGQEGTGRLLLLLQVDNGLLYASAAHNTQLYALWERMPVASSLGPKGLEDSHILSGDAGWTQDDGRVEQRTLKWGDEARSPSLLVRQPVNSPFSSQGLWLAGIAIMAGIMVVVWWVLGVWMSRMAGRIASLGAASREFTRTHELTPLLRARLEGATGSIDDEIHDVAASLVTLTEAVEEREQMLELRVAARTADLEEAKSQAEALNHMLNTVLDTIPMRIFWKDRYRVYLGCNQLFAQDAGKASSQEVVGATDYDMGWCDSAERYRAEDALIMETNRPELNVEEPLTYPEGTAAWVRTSKVPLRDAAGAAIGVLGIYEDITEEKQIAEALVAARNAAEASSRAKSEFLASMSHELRTPLNAILGFSQLFGMASNLPKDAKEQAREIERAGQHLLSLVNDLIDLAGIESGKLELSLETVPVKSVVSDSLAMVAPMARKQGIELVDEDGEGRAEMVRADYVRLRQVIINLLSNAIKYNRPHGTVRLSCQMNDGKVRIRVADTGPGIAAEKQSRIFSAFDRLGAERGIIEGTGIGLVITQRLVEAMGGTIGFVSAEGHGSTFWVEFPESAPTELPALEANAAATLGTVQPFMDQVVAHRPLVLYIEDNPMNLRLMQHIFAIRKNLELRDAHTAELGIELARAELPALILMDINLPGMDGYVALAVLKADPKTTHIPVIAVSANAMKGDEERGLEAGFAAYFTKPVDIPLLFATLDKLAEQKKIPNGSGT